MIDRRKATAILFVAITIGIWAYLIRPTINYVYYYSALEGLTLNVSNMTVTNGASSIKVSFTFRFSNPTPYLGLRLSGLTYQARLPNGSDSLLMASGGGGFSGPTLIGAYSSLVLPSDFTIQGLRMEQYMQLYAENRGVLQWSIEGGYTVGTRDGLLFHQFQVAVTQTS